MGLPADMAPILDIAHRHNLRVIEDSCETMFADYRGRKVGSWSDVGCFSTYIAHYIVTGVGGLATTNDAEMAVHLKSLMNHGRDSIYLTIDDDSNCARKSCSRLPPGVFALFPWGTASAAPNWKPPSAWLNSKIRMPSWRGAKRWRQLISRSSSR